MKIFILIGIWFSASICHAKILFYDKKGVAIEVPFGQEAFVKFDKQVKTITQATSFVIKPTNEEEPDYSNLTITPKFTAGSEVLNVILEDGGNIKLVVKILGKDVRSTYDAQFDLRARETQAEFEQDKDAPKIGEIELMKALMRDDFIAGFHRRILDRPIDVSQNGVSAKIIRHYEGQGLQGFVFKVTNHLTLRKVNLDLKLLRLGKPNVAILSQADDLELNPKTKSGNETYVRIVSKQTARMNDVRLPVAAQKGDKELGK